MPKALSPRHVLTASRGVFPTSKLQAPFPQHVLRYFLPFLERGLVLPLDRLLPGPLLDIELHPAHPVPNLDALAAAAHREDLRLLVHEVVLHGGRVVVQVEAQVDGQREQRRATLAMRTVALVYLRS